MSTVFQDISLSAAQIEGNYTYKQIKIADDHATDNVFVDAVRDNIVVANVDNTFDNATEVDLVLVGTGLTNTLSDSVVNIGHNTTVNVSDAVVCIGGANIAGPDNLVSESDNVVNIGHSNQVLESNNIVQIGGNSTVGNVAPFLSDNAIVVGYGNLQGTTADSFDNISIGNVSAPPSGDNNIVIGQSPAWHDQTATPHNHNIILAHRPLLTTLPTAAAQGGSVIIGGGGTPSDLPKLQFLSPDMEPLIDSAQTATYAVPIGVGVAGSTALINPAGYIRVKYGNLFLRIPFIDDNDAAIP